MHIDATQITQSCAPLLLFAQRLPVELNSKSVLLDKGHSKRLLKQSDSPVSYAIW